MRVEISDFQLLSMLVRVMWYTRYNAKGEPQGKGFFNELIVTYTINVM